MAQSQHTLHVPAHAFRRLALYVIVLSHSIRIRVNRSILKALDDQMGVELINRVFGAFLVQTLRALDNNSELNESTLPDLEVGLERFTRWGSFAEKRLGFKSAFLTVVKGYGVKLFRDRTDSERRKLRDSRLNAYKQFLKDIPDSERVKRKLLNGEYVGGGDDNPNPWEGASEEDMKLEHPDFDTESVWTAYLM